MIGVVREVPIYGTQKRRMAIQIGARLRLRAIRAGQRSSSRTVRNKQRSMLPEALVAAQKLVRKFTEGSHSIMRTLECGVDDHGCVSAWTNCYSTSFTNAAEALLAFFVTVREPK